MIVSAAVRFWRLDSLPPGLYRDEAFNGLDALGVLDGHHAVFFTTNNGREPAYIYLTAMAVALFGRSVVAVRVAAAVAGTLTTWLLYQLAATWFDRRTGILAAWLWGITLWPIHLSRIGLRPILLVPCLTLLFWLGTHAYRQRRWWLWLLAGLVYGAGFYTYLAIRFTPVLLLIFAFYLSWQYGWRTLWPGLGWFGLGTAVALFPLLIFYVQFPDLLLGRTGQVSIFNQTINQGDFWGALWSQIGHGLGLFFWRGDSILRHNPAGRPLFDWFMTGPFLIGAGWCLRHWRQPAAMITLLWTLTMLGPTVLAEDTPHFLRAAGILPGVLLLPALGLSQLWQWPQLPARLRQCLVLGLALGSFSLTGWDYLAYGRNPDVALLFEAAATELAYELRDEAPDTAVYLDRWFWDEAAQKGWPSIPFLVDMEPFRIYRPELGVAPAPPGIPVSIYAWRFGNLDFVPGLMPPSGLISVMAGSLARGDLETKTYPLYIRYHGRPLPESWPEPVNFDDQFQLRQGTATLLNETGLQIDLYWEAQTAVSQELTAFVHVSDANGIIRQSDTPVGSGHWLWWQPGQIIHEQRILSLPQPFVAAQHFIQVGLYDPTTLLRLPILDASGHPIGDSWTLPPP